MEIFNDYIALVMVIFMALAFLLILGFIWWAFIHLLIVDRKTKYVIKKRGFQALSVFTILATPVLLWMIKTMVMSAYKVHLIFKSW